MKSDISQYKLSYYLNPEEVVALKSLDLIELELLTKEKSSVKASLIGVSPVVDSKTQKLEVQLKINNYSKNFILAGQHAKLNLDLVSSNGFLKIPKEFVKVQFEQYYVTDMTDQLIPIKVIREHDKYYHISPLIANGES